MSSLAIAKAKAIVKAKAITMAVTVAISMTAQREIRGSVVQQNQNNNFVISILSADD